MKVILWLSQEEVHKKIDYSLICETMCSATWNTGKRKRLMKQFFTESEIEKVYKLKQQAYTWTLTKGVPKEGVKLSVNTLSLWTKLADFCMML